MSVYRETDPFYRSPFGAVKAGQAVRFQLTVPPEWGVAAPFCVLNRDGLPPSMLAMEKTGSRDGLDVFAFVFTPQCPGLFFYYFDLYRAYRKIYCGPLLEGEVREDEGTPFQLTVYDPAFSTPNTLKGGVMYQIFPDRFFEGRPCKPLPFPDRIYRADKAALPFFEPVEEGGHINKDYFGGDFEGIRKKLPYLKTLGVTYLYLNPIFEAHENHRYNTADYLKADPGLGTNEEFALLCKEAKALDIRILLDGVFSHTGADSFYFDKFGRYGSVGAFQNENSPYRPWYFFGSEYENGYRSWWNFASLPEVREEEPSYRAFVKKVIDFWLGLGAAGFRLDVADELPDDFLVFLRQTVKAHGGEFYLCGEVWEDASCKISYGARRSFLLGKQLDSVMNYPVRSAVLQFLKTGNGPQAADLFLTLAAHYPPPALHTLMNLLSTHDTPRAATALCGKEMAGQPRALQAAVRLTAPERARASALMRLGFALLFFLPGVPVIYYGDEIAMEGCADPFNRAYFNWQSSETLLKEEIARLSVLRRSSPAFFDGAFSVLFAGQNELWLCREAGDDRAVLAVNLGETPIERVFFEKTLCCGALDYGWFSVPSALAAKQAMPLRLDE